MKKEEFNKFPMGEILFALLTIIGSILTVVFSVVGGNTGHSTSAVGWAFPAIILLVISVAVLASLTIKRVTVTRVFILIFEIGLVVYSAITTIVSSVMLTNYNGLTWQNVGEFTIQLLLLVFSVLHLIYFLASLKNDKIDKRFILLSTILLVSLLFINACWNIVTVTISQINSGNQYFPDLGQVLLSLSLMFFGFVPLFFSRDVDVKKDSSNPVETINKPIEPIKNEDENKKYNDFSKHNK